MNFELNTDNINFTLNLGALEFFVNGVGNPAPPVDESPSLDFSKASNSQYIPIIF